MPELVSRVDLRPLLPPIRDQGQRQTCLAFAITGGHEMERAQGAPVVQHLSEEVLCWGGRQVDVHTDGMTFKAAGTALGKWGQPEAHLWPYDGLRDDRAPTYLPPPEAIHAAHCFKATLPAVQADIDNLKECLLRQQPVVLSVKMSYQFFDAPNGHLEVPQPTAIIQHTHAVLLVGFHDATDKKQAGHFIFRNSWGIDWGDDGYGYMPYNYVTQCGMRACSLQPLK